MTTIGVIQRGVTVPSLIRQGRSRRGQISDTCDNTEECQQQASRGWRPLDVTRSERSDIPTQAQTHCEIDDPTNTRRTTRSMTQETGDQPDTRDSEGEVMKKTHSDAITRGEKGNGKSCTHRTSGKIREQEKDWLTLFSWVFRVFLGLFQRNNIFFFRYRDWKKRGGE
ncbi:hypothetical protein BDV59DRAFT_181396 [Aspergillus ambiguus]|uniref:uncharacterized protein n=1 Tax=Aspergillus ambiguus TaxID=176160 RepID=UPI003CCDBE8A